jgi:hypothetical protein
MNQKTNALCSKFYVVLVFLVAISITNSVESEEATKIVVSSEMEKFIQFRAIDSGMPYESVKKAITKDKLPLLYELLAESEYAPYWNNIARIIGYISDDPNSIDVLLIYFQRDDVSLVDSIAGKVGSLAWIGKIGGQKADSILKKAITKEGVHELAKLWIDKEEWKKGRDKRDKDQIIAYIQGAAIDGLVYSGKKENWDIVDRLYNDTSQEDIRSKLVEAMAKKAYITDHNNDVEPYFRIDSQTMYKSLKKYLEEYDPSSEVVIRKAVAIQLNKNQKELTEADFAEITKLNIDNTHISNLEPIKRLKNLHELSAYNNPISDIEPLRELVNLQKLILNSTQITNLEPLSNLTNLKELYISKTPVSDLRPLRELTNLQKLFIQLCNNLPAQQVQELQKALPELKIQRAGLR